MLRLKTVAKQKETLKTFRTEVKDGKLDIEFTKAVNFPSLNGIRVESRD